MIQLTRGIIRQFRALLRKAGAGKNQRPMVEVTAGQGEVRIRAAMPDITIEVKQPSAVPTDSTESVVLPFEALGDFEGKSNEPVTLASNGEAVEVRWDDGKIPRIRTYPVDASATRPTIPVVDWQEKSEVPGFLAALGHASRCTSGEHPRYATYTIQLRGNAGEVIATDGRQALVQSGFSFPWKEDLLIPSLALFGCRELPLDLPATVCKGNSHLAIQMGDWTIYLALKEGRFPDVGKIIPNVTAAATTLRLSSHDASFVAKCLDKLPGSRDDFSPVTIDLNGQVALRAKEDGQGQPTEVILAGSDVTGSPVCCHTDRRYLERAVSMGFTEISIVGADQPLVCKDHTRTYLWVLLAKSLVIPSSDKAIRITSQDKTTIPKAINERMNAPMPTSNSNGRGHANGENQANVPAVTGNSQTNGQINGATDHTDGAVAPASNSLGALIAEAQALRDYLHDGYARANRLCASLKRHRKQSKLVATTLASLRQLQQIDG